MDRLGPVSQDVLEGRLLPYVTTAEKRAAETHNAKIQGQIISLKSILDRKAEALTVKYLEERLTRLPEVLRGDLRTMLATAPDKRDAVQRYLAGKLLFVPNFTAVGEPMPILTTAGRLSG